MRHHWEISRRDFLKLLGATGLLFPASYLLRFTTAQSQMENNPAKPNFIILAFDALSARHMSLYGYKRKTTPNIEKFAKTSTVFRQHHAACNYTKSSVASCLTGVLPWSHRALGYYSSLLKFYGNANIFGEITPDFYTRTYTENILVLTILNQLAAYIRQNKHMDDLAIYNGGKLTGIFKNDSSVGFYATEQLSQNFSGTSDSLFINPILDIAQSLTSSAILQANAKSYPFGLVNNQHGNLFKLETVIDWIARSLPSTPQPYLSYFHLFPPHEPYSPRADFAGMFSGDGVQLIEKSTSFFSQGYTQEQLHYQCELYDEYIAFVDSEFGRLYGMLQENGALDNTYLILTSDHGQLFERGIHGHGTTLYESVIHIPLIIHAPGQNQREDIYSPTSNTDIVPTILQLTNQDLPNWLEGMPLPNYGGTEDAQRIIFSMEGKENQKMKPLTKATFSAIQWPYKLINYRGYPGYDNVDELFDLDNDPEELNNLAASRPSLVTNLKHKLQRNQTVAEQKAIRVSIKAE